MADTIKAVDLSSPMRRRALGAISPNAPSPRPAMPTATPPITPKMRLGLHMTADDVYSDAMRAGYSDSIRTGAGYADSMRSGAGYSDSIRTQAGYSDSIRSGAGYKEDPSHLPSPQTMEPRKSAPGDAFAVSDASPCANRTGTRVVRAPRDNKSEGDKGEDVTARTARVERMGHRLQAMLRLALYKVCTGTTDVPIEQLEALLAAARRPPQARAPARRVAKTPAPSRVKAVPASRRGPQYGVRGVAALRGLRSASPAMSSASTISAPPSEGDVPVGHSVSYGNGHANGYGNGNGNGHANGYGNVNGYGNANGHANGYGNVNGHANGNANGNGHANGMGVNNRGARNTLPEAAALKGMVLTKDDESVVRGLMWLSAQR